MVQKISQSKGLYSGPAYNAMRTTLLETVKTKVTDALAPWLELGKDVTGFVAVSDAWTDAQSRPIMNFMLANPKGVKFEKSVNSSGHVKDGAYIADLLIDVIEEIGPEHVTTVIMDGASNNVAAREIIEERYGCSLLQLLLINFPDVLLCSITALLSAGIHIYLHCIAQPML